MKTFRLIKFLDRRAGDLRPGPGTGVLFVLCAGAILLFGVTNELAARGGAWGGYGGARVEAPGIGVAGEGAGARGVGVAPGVGVGSPGNGALPNGYVRTVPAGYTTVVYNGSTCYFVNGVYYCPVFYQGTTVYVATQ